MIGEVTPKQPMRRCVGCKTSDSQSRLVRAVRSRNGQLSVKKKRQPGRGAYVHPREICIQLAGKGGFARSFRAAVKMPNVRDFMSICVVGDAK